MITIDKGLAADFRDECEEQLATIEAELLALETGGTEVQADRLDRAIRGIHSIQGGATFLNLAVIGDLAGQMKDVLTLIRSRRVRPPRDAVTTLLSAKDRLDELVQNAGASQWADISPLMADLGLLRAGYTGAPAGQTISRGRRPRFLVVEDDVTSRLLLKNYLSKFGECHTAVNGRDALVAFRSSLEQKEAYDLVCMDIMMPEMDGHQAVREIRAFEDVHGEIRGSGVKIVMTTTVDEIREVILCFKELCDAYLMKPINLVKLRGYLRSYRLVD